MSQVPQTRSRKKQDFEMKKISIAVTSIAPLINLDHYNNFPRIISQIWKKVNLDDYSKFEKICREKNLILSTDGFIRKINTIEKRTGIKNIISKEVRSINAIQNKSANVLKKQQEKVETIIKDSDNLNESNKKELIKLVHSATNTRYGISNENIGVKLFNQFSDDKIINQQDSQKIVFYKDDINGYIFEFTGRCDGITKNNKIIEIKNRQSKLFNEVRDYEMCQIQTYLHSSGYKSAYLVEVLPGSNLSNSEFGIIEVVKNNDYYDSMIKPYISKIVKFLMKLKNNEFDDEFKLALISGDSDKLCYKTYLNL